MHLIDETIATRLEVLIEKHHKLFKKFGPVVNMWCMRRTEKSGCLELTSRCLTMGQPSYIFSCNI